ncbi:MaoC/PaaZ C-terminal domain-containing protein [Azoarcus sp. KH32C]|uniref:MaoC/PaaZ C-terminal domain-containing protein n=1 Tax=Azoarcus sp. KH32C TaxID=748247 RepID=UPI0002385E92|nr:MaoC/PaaZ C-terminal domain-containing protein [Azoarcus sp. KH32C]BAL23445.1 hypothetical protein AZKH_1115 [Azoarcus sp. KH32C]
MYSGPGFNELQVGERFENGMTLTETHIVMGARLFGDVNPLHANRRFASEPDAH